MTTTADPTQANIQKVIQYAEKTFDPSDDTFFFCRYEEGTVREMPNSSIGELISAAETQRGSVNNKAELLSTIGNGKLNVVFAMSDGLVLMGSSEVPPQRAEGFA